VEVEAANLERTAEAAQVAAAGSAQESTPARFIVDSKGVVIDTLAPEGAITSTSQLQKKFKHAGDFGVTGTPNKANLQAFDNAIQGHIRSPGTQKVVGTYRGSPANIYVDPTTGLAVVTDVGANFISGWKLSAQQLWHVLNGGRLGGG
jgi:Colicin D